MAIKEYSRARDGEKKLSPSFRVREFACGDGSDPIMIDEELVVVLQCIRDVNGSKTSQHLLGRAADFWVEGVTIAAVADYAETLLPERGGIGRYPKDKAHPKRKTGWVHVDTRPKKSRWTL